MSTFQPISRQEIIQEIKDKNFFSIRELVCSHVFNRFGENAWQFLDTELLHTLLIVRKFINKPMIVNNWYRGGSFSQRGLRCNICQLVKTKTNANTLYMTSHANGAGVDFDVQGMTAAEVRKALIANEDILPYPIRLEDGVTWVHLDIYDRMNGKKINLFT